MTEPEKMIACYIQELQEAREAANPLLYCNISPTCVQAVEARLYALPELCEQVTQSEGLEKLLISQEISTVKRALSAVSNDPYYELLPAKYFYREKERSTAANANCNASTVWHNRSRLLEKLAFLLYGVTAWYKMSSL